jgi:hypothetical protein
MSCNCGIWPLAFGGWSDPACKIHDYEYELMHKGVQTKTLDQVDQELLVNLLILAHKGILQKAKIAAAYSMYSVAHAYGLIFWHGPR